MAFLKIIEIKMDLIFVSCHTVTKVHESKSSDMGENCLVFDD